MSFSLPKYIHLLTFEPWKSGSILIRFEHILEKNEDNEAITFNFQDVFGSFDVISIRETTLSANQWLDKAARLEFTAETDNNSTLEETFYSVNDDEKPKLESNSENLQITLNPMQIRTFVVEMKWKA